MIFVPSSCKLDYSTGVAITQQMASGGAVPDSVLTALAGQSKSDSDHFQDFK